MVGGFQEGDIIVMKNGLMEGPYSERAVAAAMGFGDLDPQTPAQRVGESQWRTLAEILSPPVAAAPDRVPPDDRFAAPPAARRVSIQTEPDDAPPAPSIMVPRVAIGCVSLIVLLVVFGALHRTATSSPAAPGDPSADASRGDQSPPDPPTDGKTKVASSLREAEACVLMARSGDSAASAFFAIDKGQVYIYTNIHAIDGEDLLFTDFRGNRIPFSSSAETAETPGDDGIDIVRFKPLTAPKLALQLADREEIEDKPQVRALGDSAGAGVLASLEGTIEGVGPHKIEVDCEFVPGNSGGPIVTSAGRVAAIASYIVTDPSLWAKGTRKEFRRFGWIPASSLEWSPSSVERILSEKQLVEDSAASCRLLLALTMVNPGITGFEWPDNLTVRGDYMLRDIIDQADGHPLLRGLRETSDAVNLLNASSSSPAEIIREYLRFYDSCHAYADSELRSATQSVKSAFWRAELNSRLSIQEAILTDFQDSLSRFKRQGKINVSLSDS
jgi:S1-C subfamily serine protease